MGIRDRAEIFTGDAFTQYYTRAIQFLYYYDYLLTLPDEVPFAPYPLLQHAHRCIDQLRLGGKKNVE